MAAKNELGGKSKKKFPKYTPDHKVGMVVPVGGSNCAKCEYVSSDGKACSNRNFVGWNGSKFLPAPADRYCCDFFESADEDEEKVNETKSSAGRKAKAPTIEESGEKEVQAS